MGNQQINIQHLEQGVKPGGAICTIPHLVDLWKSLEDKNVGKINRQETKNAKDTFGDIQKNLAYSAVKETWRCSLAG